MELFGILPVRLRSVRMTARTCDGKGNSGSLRDDKQSSSVYSGLGQVGLMPGAVGFFVVREKCGEDGACGAWARVASGANAAAVPADDVARNPEA